MGWAHDDAVRTEGSREALAGVTRQLPERLREVMQGHLLSPEGCGMVVGQEFVAMEKRIGAAEAALALCQEQQAERWEELRDLKRRNRLLAALLLHAFGSTPTAWTANDIEAALDGVKDRDLMLRRDPASGTLYLRAAPKGDPEPWERL